METGNPVASPTHEPTATTVAEPSHSPQAPPREEPVKTNRPSTDTVEAGKGTSHTRRVKEARDERDSDATCSVAHVHCGSACRCGQFSEKTAQIEQGKHEPSGESQTLLWNDIGGFGNLKCNLLLVASELDCGKILQESVIGEVEVNSGSGELSASFFWERRLQGNGSTSLALPIVYFTHLNVLDDTLRQPIVAKPVVKWADVTFGIHEAHATGRFSINVAVNEGFHAYISFCVT